MNVKFDRAYVLSVLSSGVYADKVGIEAAEMLLRNIRHNGCVDEFLQDQVRHTICVYLESNYTFCFTLFPVNCLGGKKNP